jgi:hypothetical protein
MSSIIITFVLIILLTLYFVVSSYRGRKKRLQSFQAFAAQNGWAFVPNMAIENFQGSDSYELFNPRKGYSKRITALMKRPFEDGEAFIFDYSYTVNDRRNRNHYDCTVLAFQTPHLQLPYFALYPESFFSLLGEYFGYHDINFASHPNFSENFKLCGKDEEQLQKLFQPQVLTFFEKMQGVSVDGGGNYLFMYKKNNVIPLESLNPSIKDANNAYALFRAADRTRRATGH